MDYFSLFCVQKFFSMKKLILIFKFIFTVVYKNKNH